MPVRVFRTGQSLPVLKHAESVMDALLENTAKSILSLNDQSICSCIADSKGGTETRGATPDYDNIYD